VVIPFGTRIERLSGGFGYAPVVPVRSLGLAARA
jgi:hypothetical protein